MLVQLLEELQEEGIHSDVETVKTSKAIIYLNDEAEDAEDGIELNGRECVLLFASHATLVRLMEALEPHQSTAALALYDVTLPGEILEELERNFVTVDEG